MAENTTELWEYRDIDAMDHEALLRFRARSAGMFQTLQSQHIK